MTPEQRAAAFRALTPTERARRVERAALHFRIWQVGEALGWDCTAAEIADELRLSPMSVGTICAKRGWPVRWSKQDNSAGGGTFTDAIIAVSRIRARIEADA